MTMTGLQRPLKLALGLGAAVVLASCAQAGSPATPPTSAPTTASPGGHGDANAGHPTNGAHTTAPSTAPFQAAGKRITISVTGKQVTPEPATISIAVGESLTIAVTSDKDNTLDAHGFDKTLDLKAGQPGEMTISGTKTGVFEVELHSPELRLFQLAVR